jgi:hypothetical protein
MYTLPQLPQRAPHSFEGRILYFHYVFHSPLFEQVQALNMTLRIPSHLNNAQFCSQFKATNLELGTKLCTVQVRGCSS